MHRLQHLQIHVAYLEVKTNIPWASTLCRASKVQTGWSLHPDSWAVLRETVVTRELHTEWLEHEGGESTLCALQALREVVGEGQDGAVSWRRNGKRLGSRDKTKLRRGLSKVWEVEKESGCGVGAASDETGGRRKGWCSPTLENLQSHHTEALDSYIFHFSSFSSLMHTANWMFFYGLQDPHQHCLLLIPYNGEKISWFYWLPLYLTSPNWKINR